MLICKLCACFWHSAFLHLYQYGIAVLWETYCTHQGHIALQTYLQGQVLSTVGIAHHLITEYCLTDWLGGIGCVLPPTSTTVYSQI